MAEIENTFDDFPAIGRVMSSKMITENRHRPRFMYKQKPANELDSGWRIFSGMEDDAYATNPDNTGIYEPLTVLMIDPSIAPLLLNPVGTVFKRQSENHEWYEVENYPFEDDYLVQEHLRGGWSVKLSNLFSRHDDEQEVVFAMRGRTVRITIGDFEGNSKEDIYEQCKLIQQDRGESDPSMMEFFDVNNKERCQVGRLVEETDDGKVYQVLYGFAIIDGGVAECAIYFDKNKDKDWALETWRSIKCG